MNKKLKYFIKTFGCTYNKNSSNIIEGILLKNGYTSVNNERNTDIIIINSCIVKINTEAKILFLLKKLVNNFPDKIFIVCGCMPEVMPKTITRISPKINLIGPFFVTKILHVIKEFQENKKPVIMIGKRMENKLNQPKRLKNKLIDIIPIAQGCVNSCNYCIVKKAMGALRSYSIDSIINSIKNSIQEGAKEIRLTSQDLSAYGIDLGVNLAQLLKQINYLKGEFRIRLGMMNPSTLLPIIDGFLDACNNERIYSFFHLPIQSGDNVILEKMNRKYTIKDFLTIYEKIKSKFEIFTLSTDIICGYPSETENNFNNTLRLIERIAPDIVNISKYGHRPGTVASNEKDLNTKIKKKRSKSLTILMKSIIKNKYKRLIDKKSSVLFLRRESQNLYWGRTDWYYPIVFSSNKNVLGKILDLKIKGYEGHRLIGTPIHPQ
ncbi:MAG: tRNA (N(6)-L-threonylcarbamoyladenosine(37)-C(2))-methylthiotransferase [Candidatus Lokiarchaeota archaeon]|nr:tRNA (N(6)-L-threonylcarbamoyladenosine(37)-C(2))-methylthiotransferase [Candidatus Lokiarchaeota archaeon]